MAEHQPLGHGKSNLSAWSTTLNNPFSLQTIELDSPPLYTSRRESNLLRKVMIMKKFLMSTGVLALVLAMGNVASALSVSLSTGQVFMLAPFRSERSAFRRALVLATTCTMLSVRAPLL